MYLNDRVIIMYETIVKETPFGLAIQIPVGFYEYEDDIDSYEGISVSLVFF